MAICCDCGCYGHPTGGCRVEVSVCPQDADGYPVDDAAAVQWEAAAWPAADPARPVWVELFDSESEARAAVERYAVQQAPVGT